MEWEAPGSYLSIRGPIPLWSPEDGTAPAPARPGPHARTLGGASGQAGAWWPGPSRHPGRAWRREAALGALVVHSALGAE